jgi:SAM-dependent methyltransferase
MPVRGDDYDSRFARLAAQGQYLHGEADLVTWLLGDRSATVLDAGCGTGRVAIELVRRGYEVVGVDVDPAMLDTARAKAPQQQWMTVDLASVALPKSRYDLVVAAGNVMIFLEIGTEAAVVHNMGHALVAGGLLVAGFQVGRQLPLDRYDALCAAAGLQRVARWSTWERDPYAGGDYAVSVHKMSNE